MSTPLHNNTFTSSIVSNNNTPLSLSVWSGYFKKSISERKDIIISEYKDINKQELEKFNVNIDINIANNMIENCIGIMSLPIGLGLNFIINNCLYNIPMVTEEPSVIAAASGAAKFIAENSQDKGFITTSTKNIMIGQIQLLEINEFNELNCCIQNNKSNLIGAANLFCSSMVKRGGGVIEIKLINRPPRLNSCITCQSILYIYVDVCDSMGANIINTICEGISPTIINTARNSSPNNSNARIGLRILSNLCLERRAKSIFRIPIEKLSWKGVSGVEVAKKLIEAYEFACVDEFRACTNNKGIMNGIDSVALACGQDFRAIESSAHTFAWKQYTKQYNNNYTNNEQKTDYNNHIEEGIYGPLAHYKIVDNMFIGSLELPVSVGIAGGSITTHPLYKLSLKLLNNPTARQLSEILVTVGLAQNFAAIRALAIEGIQKGHMALHAKNIVIATGENNTQLINETAQFLAEINRVNKETAQLYLKQRKDLSFECVSAPSTLFIEILPPLHSNFSKLTILLLFPCIQSNLVRLTFVSEENSISPIQLQLFSADILNIFTQTIHQHIAKNPLIQQNELEKQLIDLVQQNLLEQLNKHNPNAIKQLQQQNMTNTQHNSNDLITDIALALFNGIQQQLKSNNK